MASKYRRTPGNRRKKQARRARETACASENTYASREAAENSRAYLARMLDVEPGLVTFGFCGACRMFHASASSQAAP
jgi:hypothetical protein